ncbi:DUF4136 domain-containing protein [Pontiella sp.]|uniref:DUF4136 domain-containing protein n=1 Tax=Pontiella sp. TaxID=2837462 RepID=UPI00356A5833
MKIANALLVAATLSLLTGCNSMKVTSATTGDFDFGAVQTYQWMPASTEILSEEDTYLNENVQLALNNEMALRGWKQVVDADKADIEIIYYMKLKEHEEYTENSNTGDSRPVGGFTFNNDTGRWGYRSQNPDINMYSVEVGTLFLQIYDSRTSENVWSGILQTELNRSKPLEKQKDLLHRIAQKITSRIP